MNDIVLERPGAAPSPPEEPVAAVETTRAHPAPSWAAIGIFLLLLLAGLAYAREFLMPVVLAFLLALVFTPVRRFLDRHGVPSWLSAILIVGALLAVIVGGICSALGAGVGLDQPRAEHFQRFAGQDARPARRRRNGRQGQRSGRENHQRRDRRRKRRKSSSSSRASPPRSPGSRRSSWPSSCSCLSLCFFCCRRGT